MNGNRKILMVASENDALVGGKVGGIGDVVRDMPVALADQGCTVDVLTPAYQLFSKQPGAISVASFDVRFAGKTHPLQLYKIRPRETVTGVTHWAVELPRAIYGNSSGIYFNDPATEPFATDATKFACFCAAAGTLIVNGLLQKPDVIHLHDWHSAMLLLLRKYDPSYYTLRNIRSVYSIHNLALQGTRPLVGHESSLFAWFPELIYEPHVINDPRFLNCINPMRLGINMADKVHTVSPTYATEILLPSDIDSGFVGGEGLENDLITANIEGKLVGILNGCVYPDHEYKKMPKKKLATLLDSEIFKLIVARPDVDSALYAAQKRAETWASRRQSGLIITSIGRITGQKISILKHKLPSGKSALEEILIELGDDGVFILLGSGQPELEQYLTAVSGLYSNLIYVRGYCEALSQALYSSGDLFLMPSSFEPCGISQMLAMRAGQPCLVHAVGGLCDTVEDSVNGFHFRGDSITQQAENLVQRFIELKQLKQQHPANWKTVCNNAKRARFLWEDSAQQYISNLYQF